MHIRPEAYFDKKENSDTTGISTDFMSNIEEGLGRKLTPEEKMAMSFTKEDYDDPDTIERIDG